jgi:multiple sugar transport system permease protein
MTSATTTTRARGETGVDPDEAARLRRRYARRHVLARIGVYTAVVLAAVACAGPFLWSAVTATKLNADLYNVQNNPFLYNRPPTAEHLVYLFAKTSYLTFVKNTLVVAVLFAGLLLQLGVDLAVGRGWLVDAATAT